MNEDIKTKFAELINRPITIAGAVGLIVMTAVGVMLVLACVPLVWAGSLVAGAIE